MFGIADRTNKRGRPWREWMDDIVSWCKTRLQELNSLAQNRRRRKLITKQAMDTNWCWSHGSWRRRSSTGHIPADVLSLSCQLQNIL